MLKSASNLANLFGRNVWPLADQALIAAASFLTLALLARQVSVAEFGGFTLVFSLLYFANSMQSGLVTQPHNVLGAARGREDYARYTTTTALSQLALAVISSLLALAGWMIALLLDSNVAPLLLAAAPATFAWQLQEFVRRVLYTEQRLAAAFTSDLIGYGARSLAVVLLWRANRLNGEILLYAMSAAYALACVVGAWQLRSSLARRIDLRALTENWHFGKWVAGGTIIGEWLSAQMLVYIAAAAIGAAAAGILQAVHTLFGPARILAQVFSILLPTRLAMSLQTAGRDEFLNLFKRAMLAAVVIFGTYSLAVALLAEQLLGFVFGEKYVSFTGVLQLYAISAFVTHLYLLFAAALRAMRQTRAIFLSELIYLVVIPLGALLIPFWELSGLVIGLIAGDLATTVFVARALAKNLRDGEAHPADENVVLSRLPQGALP